MIKQSNTILQKEAFKKSVDKVHSVKEEIKNIFVETLKQKEEIKKSKGGTKPSLTSKHHKGHQRCSQEKS